MPRDKFRLISAAVRFDDFEGRKELEKKEPKFYKMSELFKLFRKNLHANLIPGKNVCVDETLYPFRGNCPFRQYMKCKPAKYGIKYNSVVDVETSYCLDSIPYLGKVDKNSKNAKNVGETVVLDLVARFFHSSRVVTMDNFFSSISLAKKLFLKQIQMIGTLRRNKKEIPIEFQPSKKKRVFSSQFAFHEHLTLVEYTRKINKNVILLSTFHHDASKLDENEDFKPKVIIDYNKNIGAVDTLDHIIEHFTCRRKTNRWPVNCFYYMLDVSAYNSFVLYKNKNNVTENESRQRRFFLENLSISLIKPIIEDRAKRISDNSRHVSNFIVNCIIQCGV
jgi:hypothetical protein